MVLVTAAGYWWVVSSLLGQPRRGGSHKQTLRRYSETRGGVPGHMEAIPRAMRSARDSGWRASEMTLSEASSVRISTIMRSPPIVCRLAGCPRPAARRLIVQAVVVLAVVVRIPVGPVAQQQQPGRPT